MYEILHLSFIITEGLKEHHRTMWFIRCALCMLVFAHCHKHCCWQDFLRWEVCLLWEELHMWSNEMKLCFVEQTGNRINRIIKEVLRLLLMMMMMDGWKKCTGLFCHHQDYTQKTVTVYSFNSWVSFYQPVCCYISEDINITRKYIFVTMA